MSDMNIRLLLHWLWRIWEKSGYARHRPVSFIFTAHENETQAEVLKQWRWTIRKKRSSDSSSSSRSASRRRARRLPLTHCGPQEKGDDGHGGCQGEPSARLHA